MIQSPIPVRRCAVATPRRGRGRCWCTLVRHGRMTSSVRAVDALLVLGQIIAAIGPPPLAGGRLA